MSRDIKYIGMDVHKEAIVIAVLNGSGKLVMESGHMQLAPQTVDKLQNSAGFGFHDRYT